MKWLSGILLAALSVAVAVILLAITRIAPPAAPAAVPPTIVIYPPAPAARP